MEVLIDPAGKPAHAATLDIHPATSTQTRHKTFATEKARKDASGEPDTQSHSRLVSEHMTAIDDVFIFHVNLLDATVASNPNPALTTHPQAKESLASDEAG